MMKKIFYLVILIAVGCKLPATGQTKIKGKAKLIKPVKWIYLQYQTPDRWIIDSSRIANGDFVLKANIADASLANLWIFQENDRKKMVLVPLYLEPGSITLTIKDSLQAMKVEGSKAHKEYLLLKERVKPFEEKQKEMSQQFREAGDNVELRKKANANWKTLNQEINVKVYEPYLLENPQSSIVEHLMGRYIGSWPGVESERLEKAKALFNSLPEATRKRPSSIEFERRLNAAFNSAIGRPAIDFTLKDTLGNMVTLSSFKGKYVFIDFWASWCIPCRADNPNLVKAYHQFKDKNIVIMGIAFDKTNYNAWKKAIQTDELPYLNVIDPTYPGDPTAVGNQYNIGSIPRNVLINPAGKIIAKDIPGKELAGKLTELLGTGDASLDKSN